MGDGDRHDTSVASHASLLSVRGLTRRFGGLTAVDDIDLDLAKGELVSIIGPNGAGKTTLFNLVTGLDRPDGGEVRLDGHAYHRLFAGETGGQRHRAYVPARSRVRQSQRDGECPDRRAYAAACRQAGHTADRAVAGAGTGAVAARCGEGRGGAAARRGERRSWRGLASVCCRASISRPTACPTPIAAVSRSRARWRSSRVCCCSTSRRPA